MSQSFTDTLLQWYDTYGRDLPWRRTRDPYAIWLSEIILQQTRIAQGQAYWERFLAAFPDVQALAGASEDEVLRLWQGLGYYSRARNLHAAARQIAAQGRFPDTLEGIRALKGVGDYTAAAIGSIAFGLPAQQGGGQQKDLDLFHVPCVLFRLQKYKKYLFLSLRGHVLLLRVHPQLV